VRLLTRAINRVGHEGPAELGKVEALLEAIDQDGPGNQAGGWRVPKQTLAGAVIGIAKGRIHRPGPAKTAADGWVALTTVEIAAANRPYFTRNGIKMR
jgi:tRNA(Ile)-lysidine synthase